MWYRISIIAVLIPAVTAAAVLGRSGAALAVSVAAKSVPFPVIVLDAGHGGFDGGAVAADGTNEKDINLAVTLRLDALLRAMGFETVLVRDSDAAVNTAGATIRERKRSDIRNRYALMGQYPGCIYLCVHQNYYSGASSHGAQVFYTAANTDSKALAAALQAALIADVQPDNHRAIKPCTEDVYLIYRAKETAVLIECGFLSNQTDLENLKDPAYQSKLAFAIGDGLLTFLNERDAT